MKGKVIDTHKLVKYDKYKNTEIDENISNVLDEINFE